MWCNVVNYQRLIHEEDTGEWEEHEDEKHAGSSCIDQFSACPLRDSRSYRKEKEGVDGLGRAGRGGKVRCQRSERSRAKDMKRREKLQLVLTDVSFAFHQVEDRLPW